jgi:hypothetical protein
MAEGSNTGQQVLGWGLPVAAGVYSGFNPHAARGINTGLGVARTTMGMQDYWYQRKKQQEDRQRLLDAIASGHQQYQEQIQGDTGPDTAPSPFGTVIPATVPGAGGINTVMRALQRYEQPERPDYGSMRSMWDDPQQLEAMVHAMDPDQFASLYGRMQMQDRDTFDTVNTNYLKEQLLRQRQMADLMGRQSLQEQRHGHAIAEEEHSWRAPKMPSPWQQIVSPNVEDGTATVLHENMLGLDKIKAERDAAIAEERAKQAGRERLVKPLPQGAIGITGLGESVIENPKAAGASNMDPLKKNRILTALAVAMKSAEDAAAQGNAAQVEVYEQQIKNLTAEAIAAKVLVRDEKGDLVVNEEVVHPLTPPVTEEGLSLGKEYGLF